jgi:NADP-dependent 3-hydroxy acid dehydrogenase YdfG
MFTRKVEKMDKLKNFGIKPIALDVTNEESVTNCVSQILNDAGSIDILVNNCGIWFLWFAIEDVLLNDAGSLERQYAQL